MEIADAADRPFADADTIDAGSMTVANTSTGGEKIVSFTLDLRERPRETPSPGWPRTCDELAVLGHICEGPALLPDLAFDPEGGAGDLPGKPLTLDTATGTIGFAAAPEYAFPVGQGFGAVTATFPVDVQPDDAPEDSDDGDEATFSFDVDPTSIQGAPAGAPAGRVAGAELHGASVSITFSDGTKLINDLALIPGSETDIRAVLLPGGGDQIDAPRISRPFAAARRATTPYAQGTVSISAPPVNGQGVLVVAETHGDPTGAPGGGATSDPLASNTASKITEIPFTLDEHGHAEVSVTLTDGAGVGPAPEVSGVNVLTAHLSEGPEIGKVSRPVVLRLDETLETDPPGVVDIEPTATVGEAGAQGFATITFDEPMDPGTVMRSPVHPPFSLDSGITLSGFHSSVHPVEGSGREELHHPPLSRGLRTADPASPDRARAVHGHGSARGLRPPRHPAGEGGEPDVHPGGRPRGAAGQRTRRPPGARPHGRRVPGRDPHPGRPGAGDPALTVLGAAPASSATRGARGLRLSIASRPAGGARGAAWSIVARDLAAGVVRR